MTVSHHHREFTFRLKEPLSCHLRYIDDGQRRGDVSTKPCQVECWGRGNQISRANRGILNRNTDHSRISRVERVMSGCQPFILYEHSRVSRVEHVISSCQAFTLEDVVENWTRRRRENRGMYRRILRMKEGGGYCYKKIALGFAKGNCSFFAKTYSLNLAAYWLDRWSFIHLSLSGGHCR